MSTIGDLLRFRLVPALVRGQQRVCALISFVGQRDPTKVIEALQRAGIAFGPMHLLTAPGRKSGQPRTAPIAVVPIDGQRYIIQAYPQAAWVANARNAQTVTLSRGRRAATVRLVELPVEERRPLLRESRTVQREWHSCSSGAVSRRKPPRSQLRPQRIGSQSFGSNPPDSAAGRASEIATSNSDALS
ncbi:nitroreductase family deazaflavin-dependent oxidoreductase [Nocardia sp. NPDC051981]|uniref:nitroreductase family deazaflavin-dependent oxidoreductase n=1 Tax=Nocardia sp. NPDC051981 TaxID=3155417 RepID=UPI00342F0A08